MCCVCVSCLQLNGAEFPYGFVLACPVQAECETNTSADPGDHRTKAEAFSLYFAHRASHLPFELGPEDYTHFAASVV